MEIGLIGLGKMGANMTERLLKGGHRVVAYDENAQALKAGESLGAVGADSLQALAGKLGKPRAVWCMVPAGDPTEQTVNALLELLAPGDIIVDGGNSNYCDSIRRAEAAKAKGVHFVDAGTSGGVWGLKEGYSLMVGGQPEAVERLRPIFETLAPAPDRGWARVGPSGAGHFVKMVHNGIEYGLMEAYAEGLQILKAKAEFGLDLRQVVEVWRFGSVVRSWLLDLVAGALAQDPELSKIKPWVEDSGEGRWAVLEAVSGAVPAPVIALALMRRFRSRETEPFAEKLLAAMRHEFGGHAVKPEE